MKQSFLDSKLNRKLVNLKKLGQRVQNKWVKRHIEPIDKVLDASGELDSDRLRDTLFARHNKVHYKACKTATPVIIAWGVDPEHRDFVGSFYSNEVVYFSKKNASWHKFVKVLDGFDNLRFVFGPEFKSSKVKLYAVYRRIPVEHIPHLRAKNIAALSFDLYAHNSLHPHPCQYEAIKKHLRSCPGISDGESENARVQMDALVACGNQGLALPCPQTNRRHTVLVFGEVDSQKSGAHAISSEQVLNTAIRENPDSIVYYCPHPAIAAGLKRNPPLDKETQENCVILDLESNALDCINAADHLYVIASSWGFEGLLRGKTVTCFGNGFYTGWGLTDDRTAVTRENREMTLEHLFHAVYASYQQYQCPFTGEPVNFDYVLLMQSLRKRVAFAGFFSMNELMLSGEIFANRPALTIPQHLWTNASRTAVLDLFACLENRETVYPVLTRLYEQHGAALVLEQFFGGSFYYIDACDFHNLKQLVDFYVTFFNEHSLELEDESILAFIDNLGLISKKMNGRSIAVPLAFDTLSFVRGAKEKRIAMSLIRYFSAHCEYDNIVKVLSKMNLTANDCFDISLLLNQCSYKSHKDGTQRQFLVNKLAMQAWGMSQTRFKSLMDCRISDVYLKACTGYQHEWKQAILRLMDELDAMEEHKINKRLQKLTPVLKLLVAEHERDTALALLEKMKPHLPEEAMDSVEQTLYVRSRDYESRYLGQYKPYGEHNSCDSLYAERIGWYDLGIHALKKYLYSKKSSTLASQYGNLTRLRKLSFLKKTSEIVNFAKQPLAFKGVVLLASLHSLDGLARMAPVLLELKKQGYVVIDLCQGGVHNQLTNFPVLNEFAGIIPADYADGDTQLEWYVNWKDRQVRSCGINFYQGFYEILSAIFRRYTIELTDPVIERYFYKLLREADCILRVLLEVKTKIVDRGYNVTLFGCNAQMAPYSVFRDFALSLGHERLHYALINVAYESYFSNLKDKFSHSISVVDITRYPNCRQGFLGVREKFNAWYDTHQHSAEVREFSRRIVSSKQVGQQDEARARLMADIRVHKEAGKKIICCFGKVLCDLAVPYDGGPAHTDMKDWITHTVDGLGGRDEVFVLIKPHPHEKKPEIAMDIQEFFRDFLPQTLPQNVMFLDNNGLGINDLCGLIDLGILWNGTAAIELSLLGIPVMMCSAFGVHDYHFDLLAPTSREQYIEYILAGSYRAPNQDTINRAAAQLYYMGCPEVALPYLYSFTPITNDRTGVPYWNDEQVDTFLAEGDPCISRAAELVVEGLNATRARHDEYFDFSICYRNQDLSHQAQQELAPA